MKNIRNYNINITIELDKIRLEMLEDLLFYGPNYETIVFYIDRDGVKCFYDYEVADTDEPTLPFDADELDIKIYNTYQKAKAEGLIVPGYTNIYNSGESFEFMPLKEAIKLIASLEYPTYSKDVITIYTNLWIHDITPYRLSQLLGVSKQFISQVLNGSKTLTIERKQQIAEVLKFDIKEFEYNIDGWAVDIEDFL